MNIDKITPYIATGLLCSAVTVGICYLCMGNGKTADNSDLAVISECREIISKNGNPDFDDEKAVMGAINGYLNSGGDEYTYYYPFFNSDKIQENTDYINASGTATASGFQVSVSADGNILLTDVTVGLTAYKQGLRTGDVITHIDGVSVSEQGYENYANKILGKQDTETELTVSRDGESFNMTFRRDNDFIRDVEWRKIGDISYIKIKHFGLFVAGNMSTAMDEIGDSDKFIIDLRDNGGGWAGYAVQTMEYFCNHGEMFMNHYDGTTDIYETTDGRKDAELVILINENTASAAECYASMCKQFGYDVTLVGVTTFGKGIFQQEESLSNGGQLHYTAGFYTVGDWECWQGIGIAPDVAVEMDSSLIDTDDDIQLAKAVEILD